ncbi:MAG: glutamate formimidoyltransferase [Bryobacteraceae bacterium]
MEPRLIECVPNFSEGRDRAAVSTIIRAMEAIPGVCVLDQHADPDHNRSVVTLAGPPEAVAEAALAGVGKAIELIDLNRHAGVHPRIGAADVVPFVPLAGASLQECVQLAHHVGCEIWRRFRVPVYFYGAAAARPDRAELAAIRRGQFEGLRQAVLHDETRRPDVGGPELHPTAGATAVGARGFLIACNVNLGTTDVEIARRIARKVRESSGGFPGVRAMGVALPSRNLVQISMNLTDFERTPLEELYQTIRREAEQQGVSVIESELVGMIPRKAYQQAPVFFERCRGFHPGAILENRLVNL